MRKLVILVCIALQVVVLSAMVFSRESVISSGERIVLRTAPIDPRDPFRGDYVRLSYPVNNTLNYPVKWANESDEPGKGDKVYAVLKPSIGGLHEADYLTNEKPASGLYMRGRLEQKWANLRNSNSFDRRRHVKFGIEQLFVEQGEGLRIEEIQGVRGGVQVPMEVEVAVGKNGLAVLDSYRWSPLGIDIALDIEALQEAEANDVQVNNTDTDNQPNPINPYLTIDIVNTSDAPVLINNPANDCGFTIEPAMAFQSELMQASDVCNGEQTPNIIAIAAGESFKLNVNLMDERWFLKHKTDTEVLPRAAQENELMRIVYRSTSNLSDANGDTVWIGELPSRAITMRGRID